MCMWEEIASRSDDAEVVAGSVCPVEDSPWRARTAALGHKLEAKCDKPSIACCPGSLSPPLVESVASIFCCRGVRFTARQTSFPCR